MNAMKMPLKDYLEKRCRHSISDEKAKKLESALLVEYPGMKISEILSHLESKDSLPEVVTRHIAIQETFFFRHPEQFIFLHDWLLQRKFDGKHKLSILSIGVSTGQEAYSLGFMIDRIQPQPDWKIHAFDWDGAAIDVAKRGEYSEFEIFRTPTDFRNLVLSSCEVLNLPDGKIVKIPDAIKNNIQFSKDDIFTAHLREYDIILCRNILIYFSTENRKIIIEKLAKHLKNQGILIIGAGELVPPATNIHLVRRAPGIFT
jgi:chemotaxis protein methyltransferase CheR